MHLLLYFHTGYLGTGTLSGETLSANQTLY